MRLELTRDAAAFAELAAGYLAERLERNVLATTLHGACAGAYGPDVPLFAAARDDVGGRLLGVALRTPPRALLATGFTTPAAAELLVGRWLSEDPEVPAVAAEPATAAAIAAAYTALSDGEARLEYREAMHSLTRVLDPERPATGRLRLATGHDERLLVEWEVAFGRETGLSTGKHAARTVARRSAAGHQLVWEDAGAPVSAVGVNVAIGGVARIGPVYTPPEHRNRGYATSAVAATSRRLLAAGVQRCMLHTDLANPTSNRIYAAIGYVRFADWEQHRLQPARPTPR